MCGAADPYFCENVQVDTHPGGEMPPGETHDSWCGCRTCEAINRFLSEALVRCWVSGAAHGARTLWCDSCGLRGVWVVVLVARIDTNVTVVVFVSAGCGV